MVQVKVEKRLSTTKVYFHLQTELQITVWSSNKFQMGPVDLPMTFILDSFLFSHHRGNKYYAISFFDQTT